MKICFLADSGSVHTQKWVRFFKKRGQEVILITLSEISLPDCRTYCLGSDRDFSKSDVGKLFDYITYVGKVRRILKKESPDVLHAHYATSYGLLARFSGVRPYLLSVWGSDIYDFPRRSPVHRKFLRSNLDSADLLLSTSEDMKKETKRYTDREIVVTPFGIDIGMFRPGEKEGDGFTVSIAKSLEEVYGIDLLIEGFRRFYESRRDPGIRLLIAGEGGAETALKEQTRRAGLEKAVTFTGHLGRKEIVELFQTTDVAVFPSRAESFGVAAVEAQGCGCAVIVTDVGGLPETMIDNETGFLIPPESPEAVQKGLETLYDRPDLLSEMKRKARAHIVNTYNIEDNFRDILKIYEEYRIDRKKD